jgi:hypothetical protein
MAVDKMSVSFEAGLGGAVRAAAAEAGVPLSAWLAEAAARRLRAEALTAFLRTWEDQHGGLSPDELALAEAELGLRAAADAATGDSAA